MKLLKRSRNSSNNIAILLCLLSPCTLLASSTGKVCISSTPKGSTLPLMSQKGTPSSVRIQIDKQAKQTISPTLSGEFRKLDSQKEHLIKIFHEKNEKILVSFSFNFKGKNSLCLAQKPNYGTWAFVNIDKCECKQESKPSTVKGTFIYGAETSEFKPCGSKNSYWLSSDQKTIKSLISLYQNIIKSPYQKVYLEARGSFKPKASDGFAADYKGGFKASEIIKVQNFSEKSCQ